MLETQTHLADQIIAYLTAARWFAGKGRLVTLRSLTPLPWLNDTAEFFAESAPAVRFEIAEVAYDREQEASGPREFYQLAVSYRSAPRPDLQAAEIGRFADPELGSVVAYDAAQDPAAGRVLLQAALGETRLTERDTTTRFRLTGRPGLTADLEPRVFTGQQSNTSVILGDVAMLKLFRRIELGRNLDIGVHDTLNRSGVGDVAGLFGWAEGSWTSDGVTCDADLAMVVELLTGASDGWGLALDRLEAGQGFAAEAGALGRALAETHGALREAFPVAVVPGAAVAELMQARLSNAASVAPGLLRHADGLHRCFAALNDQTLDTQRVHGDFHLGQTLHTADGWKIIDFEGEPAKTMAERALPDSGWRDVAGMLRSFDYAACHAGPDFPSVSEGNPPGGTGGRPPAPDSAPDFLSASEGNSPGGAGGRPPAREWAADCRAAFLRGYAGGDLDPGQAAAVRAYEADKAVYEVVYEVRNRPDWVSIPMAAVAALAQAVSTPGTPTESRDDSTEE